MVVMCICDGLKSVCNEKLNRRSDSSRRSKRKSDFCLALLQDSLDHWSSDGRSTDVFVYPFGLFEEEDGCQRSMGKRSIGEERDRGRNG
jgi:hypothetical protein